VNFAIAAGLGIFALATGLLGTATLAGTVLTTLLWANLMLGAFNLLPAFPMDGGRVFRAWAQRRHGRLKATEMAAKLGRWLAFGLGAWGLFNGNPVLALVGVFVWMAARRELAAVRYAAALERERMSDARWAAPPPRDFGHDPRVWANARRQPPRQPPPRVVIVQERPPVR
jgi:stage IV sporulation protein FB